MIKKYIKNTHRHSFNTEIHAGKTSSFILKWQMPVCTRVFPRSLWLFSSALYLQILLSSTYFSKRYSQSILPEGALRALPSNLPTLFNYIE
jgi:hypothetical protein